jgi:hypothetical protein
MASVREDSQTLSESRGKDAPTRNFRAGFWRTEKKRNSDLIFRTRLAPLRARAFAFAAGAMSGHRPSKRGAGPRAPGGAKRGPSGKPAPAASNPFEARANRRQHFDILGRRVKGAERNVSAARSAAAARRSSTLLTEIRAAGKRGAFIDRRFGENDSSMDEETRNLVRFQKERLRQIRASKRAAKFRLDGDGEGASGGGSGGLGAAEYAGGLGGDTVVLTHGSRPLADIGAFDDMPRRDGGSEDEDIDAAEAAGFDSARFGGGEGDAPDWRGRSQQLPAWMTAGGGEGGEGGAADGRKRS